MYRGHVLCAYRPYVLCAYRPAGISISVMFSPIIELLESRVPLSRERSDSLGVVLILFLLTSSRR